VATNTQITNVAAIAACNAVVDLLDGGAGAATVKIYGDAQPTDADTAIGAQTLLATLTCSDPAFGNAADGAPGATATASAITGDSSADATDTATWFVAADSNGLAVIEGSVGTSGADMNLNSIEVTTGVAVDITSWTFTIPES
jgi:hypothetical protein